VTTPEGPGLRSSEDPDLGAPNPGLRSTSDTGVKITVRWVDSTDAIPAALWAACFPPQVEGVWWYRTLETSGLSDQFTFHYAVIEQDGMPIGIAPAFVMDVPLDVIAPDQLAAVVRFVGKFVRFLRYQRTLFVGSPCSDEGTIGLIPGVELSAILPALVEAVLAKSKSVHASMTVFKDFADLPTPDGFFKVDSFPGTKMPLPASFDLYLAGLNSSHRNKLKKKLRLGSAAVPTTVGVIQHPNAKTLDEIFPLFWNTYEKAKTKFEKLNRRCFDRIAAEPAAHWILLRSEAQLVGFMLCFDCRPMVINKFIGLDYRLADGFLYFQLWAAAVEWATRAGFTEIQSGQTGYSAKLEIGNTLVPLTNHARHRNPLVHRIFAWQAKSISWATIDPVLAGRQPTTIKTEM
jgi:hypothetical protein